MIIAVSMKSKMVAFFARNGVIEAVGETQNLPNTALIG